MLEILCSRKRYRKYTYSANEKINSFLFTVKLDSIHSVNTYIISFLQKTNNVCVHGMRSVAPNPSK